jgi:hypothetical protein
MRELAKSFFGWLISICGVLLALAAHVLVFFANYAALKSAFELIGFEPRLLGDDSFLGPLFTSIGLGDATVSDVYAGGLALLIGVTSIVCFNYFFDAVRLFFDSRAYRASEDEKERAKAPLALRKLTRRLIYFAVLLAPLVFAIRWDLTLFKVRLEGNVKNTQSPDEILSWSPDAVSRLGEYGDWLLGRNGVGYVAATILACLLLEVVFEKMSENFDNLCYAFEALAGAQDEEQADERPTTADERPDAADEPRTTQAAPPSSGGFPDAIPAATPFTAVTASAPPPSAGVDAAGIDVTPPVAQAAASPAMVEEEEDERMVEVLSASGSEYVERGQAERRQDLVVDSTGRYWERGFYELLHSSMADPEEAAEAKAA